MNEEELPEGWASKPIADLFKMSGGGTPLKSQARYWGGSIPWLSSGDIKSARISTAIDFITKEGLEHSSAKLCEPGTVILVVRSGILKHTLPVAVLDIPAAINQDLRALDCGNREVNEWLASRPLRSFAPQILEENREGTTVQSVKTETIQAFELPIPPLAEQHRIVTAVERALTKVNAARDRLARVPVTLKRFRQAVLAAACSGRLTADWREEMAKNSPDQLKSVWPPDQTATGKRRAGRLWGGGEVTELTDDERESIPQEWSWYKVGALGNGADDAVQVGPMSMQSRDFAASGVPVLNVGCIQWGRFDKSKLDFMPEDKAGAFDRYRIHSGDILFTRSGTIGRCAVASKEEDRYLMTFHLLRVRTSEKKVLNSYLCFVFQGAEHIRRQMDEAAIGSTRAGFNTNLLASLDVPVPSIPEQHEIVRRVSALFALADRIEAKVAAAKKKADGLTQAVLAKAFRGELVPTEAELARREGRDYEPADKLMDRIRAARTKDLTTSKRVRKARA